MSFGGGGSGAITNHVHDNTPLQGGPLQLAGTTIGSLNQGSITYSDGAALQELVAPGAPAGEVLTFAPAATAPSWGAGASGSYQYLESITNAGTGAQFDCNLASSYVYADNSKLVAIGQIEMAAGTQGNSLSCQIDYGAGFLTASNYFNVGQFAQASVPATGGGGPFGYGGIAYAQVLIDDSILTAGGAGNGNKINFYMEFLNNTLGGYQKPILIRASNQASMAWQSSSSWYDQASQPLVIDGLRFEFRNVGGAQNGNVVINSKVDFYKVAL